MSGRQSDLAYFNETTTPAYIAENVAKNLSATTLSQYREAVSMMTEIL